MNGRRRLLTLLLILVALLVALTVQGLMLSRQTPAVPTSAVSYQRTFTDIANPTDVQAVRLNDTASGKVFTITQQIDGSWTSPDATGTLLPDAAIRIAATISLLPYRQILPEFDHQALSTYGFKPNPALLIQVVLKNGTGHIVAIGGLTPAQTSYYAIVDEVKGIYVLDRGPVDFLIVQLRTPPVA